MSLKYKAVLGAIWTISTSVGGRALGLIGTLLITRFLTPDEYGQVNTAWIFVASVGMFAAFGFGQYIVANPKEDDDHVVEMGDVAPLEPQPMMGKMAPVEDPAPETGGVPQL